MKQTQGPLVAVVGGGASGLAASICAAEAGAGRVMLLERQDRVGRKLLATGNGRCNLGHVQVQPRDYLTSDPKALQQLLRDLPARQVLDFFERLGLLLRQEEGRVYPFSNQAAAVLDLLRLQAAARGVEEHCSFEVTDIRPQKGGFSIQSADGQQLFAHRVILACGGMAAPKLGGGEGGYRLARQLGHSVTPLYPCLVGVSCRAEGLAAVKGVRAECAVTLRLPRAKDTQRRGEVQFNEYGVSGFPVMQLSGLAAKAGKGAVLELDLLPTLSMEELVSLLHRRRKSGAFPTLEQLLTGLVHKKLAVFHLRRVGELSRPVSAFSPAEIVRLAQSLKCWQLPVTGVQGWDGAQVTGGGVPLAEVQPGNFASRLQPGLYLTGELLDAAGDCGGFNLHWAFGSGMLAGQSAGHWD
ncbi:MAG TPA: aminoacetone oxidase family FAD-binding enzyme [Candidatus Anaerofilum excrementigallinarum]|nr:aminoacetone oxidase family FAD-binding enzyme [Candidatus Anaerofilum excrementigallinarum]